MGENTQLEFFVHKQLINYLCATILNANNILTSTIAAMLNLVRGKIMASIGIDMQIIKISEYSGVLHGDTLAINLSNELSNEYVYIKDNQLLNLQLLLPIFMQIASIFKLHSNDHGLSSALLFSDQTPIKIPIQLGSFKLTLEELQAINSGDIVFLEKLLLPPAAIEEAISAGLIAKAL